MTAPETVTTTADLLHCIRDAYEAYAAAIAALPAGMLTRGDTCGAWSVRDVMAHIGADEQWMAGQLEALQSGVPPTGEACYGEEAPVPTDIDLSTQDGRNAWQYQRLRGLSLDEVRKMAADAHARLLATTESFLDGQLSEKLTIAEMGTAGWIRRPNSGEQAWPLWEWLRGVTYHHYAEHAGMIRAAVPKSAPAQSK